MWGLRARFCFGEVVGDSFDLPVFWVSGSFVVGCFLLENDIS